MRIIDVKKDNVVKTGFFCNMSKKKSEGYQRKLRWLSTRFTEGMKLKMLDLSQGGRGFIEYIPGEYAWRPVSAKGYMFIHCLWVVGKSKGKGYAKLLLNECINDAKTSGMKGVAMVTSEGNWLTGRDFLAKHSFESIDQAPPSFEHMVNKFGKAPSPFFTSDWDRKLKEIGKGLTIICSDQCPYIDDATNIILKTAKEMGIKCRVVNLKSARDVQSKAPSAYGVFNVVYEGKLLSYHYLTKKELVKRLDEFHNQN